MPTWKELKRFCENDGWELYKSTDHFFYKKVLDNGTILYTRTSRGSGEIPKHLFARILRHQLNITKEDFNKKI